MLLNKSLSVGSIVASLVASGSCAVTPPTYDGTYLLTTSAKPMTNKLTWRFLTVVVIGGGATGTYAAVRLREDYNKTVMVIEKNSILGGHVDTYGMRI